ncbi:MAG: fructan beta-fructosidase [Maribacter sp.]|jgi:fructan beta-fructosidase
MPSNPKYLIVTTLFGTCFSCKDKELKKRLLTVENDSTYYTEDYRPQFYFTPEHNWMNDPNGLVSHQGVYHLFYPYYPEDIVWDPCSGAML